MYQMIVCCCTNSIVAAVAAMALRANFGASLRTELPKYISNKAVLTQLDSMTEYQAYILFGFVALATIFSIFFVIGTWRGRKWAYIIHVILHLPSAALTILIGQADARFGSILSIVIAIFCLLRLFGSVGPKM